MKTLFRMNLSNQRSLTGYLRAMFERIACFLETNTGKLEQEVEIVRPIKIITFFSTSSILPIKSNNQIN